MTNISEQDSVSDDSVDQASADANQELSCAAVQESAHDIVMESDDVALRDEIERHCQGCPSCARFLESLQRTATMLAFTAPMVSPSFSAKAALFARIDQTQQKSRPIVFAGDPADLATPTLPSASDPTPATIPESPSSRWGQLQAYALPLATVPLLIALGIVGVWGMAAHLEAGDARQNVSLLNARVQLLRQEISDQGSDMASIDDVLPNSKQYSMYSSSDNARPSKANGIVFADPSGHKAAVFIWSLDPEIGMYDIVLDTSSGDSYVLDQVVVNNQGDAAKVVELGRPLYDCASIRIRPTYLGSQNDLQNATDTSDILYAPIIHGLDNVVDTVSGQPSGK